MLNQIYIRIDITVFTAYPQPQRIERRSGALIAGARTHARTHTLPHLGHGEVKRFLHKCSAHILVGLWSVDPPRGTH